MESERSRLAPSLLCTFPFSMSIPCTLTLPTLSEAVAEAEAVAVVSPTQIRISVGRPFDRTQSGPTGIHVEAGKKPSTSNAFHVRTQAGPR